MKTIEEIRAILKEFTGGPIVLSASRDLLAHYDSLREETDISQQRKTDERTATETIFRLRCEKEELRRSFRDLIERCDALEAKYGTAVSHLDDGTMWARVGNIVVAGKELLERV